MHSRKRGGRLLPLVGAVRFEQIAERRRDRGGRERQLRRLLGLFRRFGDGVPGGSACGGVPAQRRRRWHLRVDLKLCLPSGCGHGIGSRDGDRGVRGNGVGHRVLANTIGVLIGRGAGGSINTERVGHGAADEWGWAGGRVQVQRPLLLSLLLLLPILLSLLVLRVVLLLLLQLQLGLFRRVLPLDLGFAFTFFVSTLACLRRPVCDSSLACLLLHLGEMALRSLGVPSSRSLGVLSPSLHVLLAMA